MHANADVGASSLPLYTLGFGVESVLAYIYVEKQQTLQELRRSSTNLATPIPKGNGDTFLKMAQKKI